LINYNIFYINYLTNNNQYNQNNYIKILLTLLENSLIEKEKMRDHVCLEKIKRSLKLFNEKSLFSLIKHFKYFDNGTKLITKFDFVKILKDFRLNLTIGEIEKIFELFCVNSKDKEQLLNFEEFILILCPPLEGQRKKIVNEAFAALIELKTEINLDLIKSVYNAKNHPKIRDEEEVLNSFIESFELYYFSYKGYKNKLVSFKEFEEFYRINSFLVPDDNLFVEIVKNEWRKVLKSEQRSERDEKVEKDRSADRTPTRSVRGLMVQPQVQPQVQALRLEESLKKPEYDAFPREKSIHQSIHSSHHSVAGSKKGVDNDLKKNLQIENNKKITENKYERKDSNANRVINDNVADVATKLKKKLRARGVRGLMNLHKQFILNCDNLEKITLSDFMTVLSLQRIDFPKKEYEILFGQFKKRNNEQVLDFKGFIEQFKKALKDPRLELVEKVFAQIDIDNKNMLSIENLRLNFTPYKLEKLEGNKTEEDLMMDFFDTFELNYNFFVSLL